MRPPLEKRKRALDLHDRDLERNLGIRPHDPTRDAFGARRYSQRDIELLEEEKVPWLRAKRRRG